MDISKRSAVARTYRHQSRHTILLCCSYGTKAISCAETDDGTYVQLHFSYLSPIISYLILLFFIFILFFIFQFISFCFLSEPRKETRDVTVQIIDRGIGISEEDRVGLFNAYSQVRPEQLQQGELILSIKYYIEAQAKGEKKREK